MTMPPRPALCGAHQTLSAAEVAARIAQLAASLRALRPRVRMLGVIADNSPEWVVIDLAAQRAGVSLVPLPGFFTLAQMQHAVDTTGMDALFCAMPEMALALGFERKTLEGAELPWFRRDARPVAVPVGTSKITFTSGTTGAPKGVCLSAMQQRAVAVALVQATSHIRIERHLSLLPLSVLLENVAGVTAPRLALATCCVPPLAEVGVLGATEFDPLICLDAIERWQADSVILLPQMLLALTAALEAGVPRPSTLRFAAVGGAKVAPALIARARAVGLPAYEGYGLSECASVVALNVPGADRPGSVGRALSHVDVRINDNHEIEVAQSDLLGYLGVEAPTSKWLHTGDLGRIDEDGFLYIDGRYKHQLITSFGRNVAPEWPEAELISTAVIAQAAVFGEARPRLCAVIVPRSHAVTDAAIDAAVRVANHQLPDYAQIAHWIRAPEAFSARNGLATPNRRVRRDAVWKHYRARLESLYETNSDVRAFL